MKLVEDGSVSGRVVAKERLFSYLAGFLFGLIFAGIGVFLMFFLGGSWAPFGPLSPDLVHWVFSGIFLLAGLALLYSNARTTIVAEKALGNVIVKNNRLLLLESVREIPVAGLQSVAVQEVEHHGNKGSRYYSYDLNLAFDGFKVERLFGTNDESVFNLFGLLGKTGKEELIEVGKAIARLFGVGYEEKGLPRLALNINLGGGPLLTVGEKKP